jgi:hypothetical protein
MKELTMLEPLRVAHWLEAQSRWSQLKSLGGSNIVCASVLMPAFGYILLLNEHVHQYLTVKYDGLLLLYVRRYGVSGCSFTGASPLQQGRYFIPDFARRMSNGISRLLKWQIERLTTRWTWVSSNK